MVSESVEINLTITGEVEVLRLQPGDRILVTIDEKMRMSLDAFRSLSEQLQEKFPDNEVIVLANGLRIAKETSE